MCWKLIKGIKFITALKTYQCITNVSLWWNSFALMEFYPCDKSYHFDDLMIYHIYHLLILGLLTKLTNFAFPQISSFGHYGPDAGVCRLEGCGGFDTPHFFKNTDSVGIFTNSGGPVRIFASPMLYGLTFLIKYDHIFRTSNNWKIQT